MDVRVLRRARPHAAAARTRPPTASYPWTPEQLSYVLDGPMDLLRQSIRRNDDRRSEPVLAELGKTATPEFKARLATWLSLSERDLFEVFLWPRPGVDIRE